MMKKLIAVLAVSAIVTTAVYAQAAVAGTVETRTSVVRGNLSDEDSDLVMGGSIGAAWLQLSGTNADGTLGSLFRLRNNDIVRAAPWFHRVFVWWRPVESFRLWLGIDQDGMFDTAHFAGWGFHAGDNDYMFNHHWDFWRRIFPGNWDSFGAALSFMGLLDGQLNINLALPTGNRNWPQAENAQIIATRTIEEMLAGFRLHTTFAIPGTGLLQFTYNAPGGYHNDTTFQVASTTWGDATSFGQIGLSFLMNGLAFGNILFGGAVVIPDSDNDLDLHLGAALDLPAATLGDVMGLRFRLGAHVLNGGGWNNGDGLITGNIMPIVGLGPGSLMFDIGFTIGLPEGDFDAEQHLGWSVKPVYRLPLAQGAFSIGLHLWSGVGMGGNQANLNRTNDVHINIPLLLRFSF